jgi:uncharacterized protein (DUF2384 family)
MSIAATAAPRHDVLGDAARASGPALRAFARIADRWDLSPAERATLLGMPRSTYFKAVKEPDRARLSRDQLERVSYVLGIYQALQILLPRRAAADSWLRRSNANVFFKGTRPLDVLLGGKVANLFAVRRYLDGERG